MDNHPEQDGRRRVIIEGVKPQVDGGRFAIKRTVREKIVVEADVFTDSHDAITCMLRYCKEGSSDWNETPMAFLSNDHWRGEFAASELGRYVYTVSAWVDHFKSWRNEFAKREQVDDIRLALRSGAELVAAASKRASGSEARFLRARAELLRSGEDLDARRAMALDPALDDLMRRFPDRALASHYERVLPAIVEDERARYSTWYELFPRSCGAAGQHGTFADVEQFLPRLAEMGFDVLYFPPIHPIGQVNRKGKNNTLTPGPDDVGVPWAIGSDEGGHKAIHSQLGSLQDFLRLVSLAREHGIEIALDIAFQCAPDHPWVQEHPQWFRWRPDGTVQYAENPPKKYQDIYPLNFETEDWRGLWQELKSVFTYWIEQGVRIFRVDNPHTKAFPFWEWCITEVKKICPDAIFLSEAFTRPRVMHRLAKSGFTQSYTYFTWRNTKWELTEYLTELTKEDGREYFRPNFWPNTPDILPEYLQFGGRPAFLVRLVLAATMTANYGIYGPAYELCENRSLRPGSEDYMDSEKYEIRNRDLERPDGLRHFITLVNRIRRENPALQRNRSLRFHHLENDQLICYSKYVDDFSNVILCVVNLDVYHTQSGFVHLPLEDLGLDPNQPYQVHDLLSNAHYIWNGSSNYVELNPQIQPAHIFRLHHRTRTEQDFDTFMG